MYCDIHSFSTIQAWVVLPRLLPWLCRPARAAWGLPKNAPGSWGAHSPHYLGGLLDFQGNFYQSLCFLFKVWLAKFCLIITYSFRKLWFLNFFLFKNYFLFYIPTQFPSSSLILPPPIHSSEGVRPSLGSQPSLAYQVEVGLSPSPLYQGWARNPTIGNGLQKTVYEPGIGPGAATAMPRNNRSRPITVTHFQRV